jgi:hypothetical protein
MTTRLHLFLAMTLACASTFLQFGCGGNCTESTCGAEGQPCYDWTNGCDDDSMGCVNGTCTQCGQPGEACCPQIKGPDDCYGSVCDEHIDATPTCSTTCGAPGLPCCPDAANYPCGDDVCDQATNTCVGLGTITSCGGSEPHWFWLVDSNGCALEPYIQFTADPGNVDACISDILAANPGKTAGPVDTDPGCSWSCQYWDDTPDSSTGADPVFTCAFSTEAQETCKYSLCSDCLYTNENQSSCGNQY